MMLRSLSADFLKIRGKGLWFLVFLAPIGIVALQALNFGLRADYMRKIYADHLWNALIENVAMFVPIAVFLGGTIISSLIAGIEHQQSSWKQLLALPVTRTAIYCAKYVMAIILLLVACVLLPIGTAILGLSLGYGTDIPYSDLVRIGFYPFIASLPLLALQLWLSMVFKNQTLPVSFGIAVSFCCLFSGNFGEFFPLNWPKFAYLGPNNLFYLVAGVGVSLMITIAGLIHFNRKDVD